MFADDTFLGATKRALTDMLGMSEVKSHGKYLGLPITIVDKVKFKVANWKPRLLFTAVRDLISKGINWKLASGNNIRVWGNRWVQHTNSKTVITPENEDYLDLRVANLLDSEIGTWKVDLVRSLFYAIENEAILQMSLAHLDGIDIPTWDCNQQGRFTIQSAYHLIMRLEEILHM
ncbi:hypothetical protein LIER_26595 [Lithospermum erythrorhizon]|uniref:Uncharacterized protein n=1 Tax=Lithospermum erythrorhizon TaxID=34254 RepID=A0AAV3RC53_LITER